MSVRMCFEYAREGTGDGTRLCVTEIISFMQHLSRQHNSKGSIPCLNDSQPPPPPAPESLHKLAWLKATLINFGKFQSQNLLATAQRAGLVANEPRWPRLPHEVKLRSSRKQNPIRPRLVFTSNQWGAGGADWNLPSPPVISRVRSSARNSAPHLPRNWLSYWLNNICSGKCLFGNSGSWSSWTFLGGGVKLGLLHLSSAWTAAGSVCRIQWRLSCVLQMNPVSLILLFQWCRRIYWGFKVPTNVEEDPLPMLTGLILRWWKHNMSSFQVIIHQWKHHYEYCIPILAIVPINPTHWTDFVSYLVIK